MEWTALREARPAVNLYGRAAVTGGDLHCWEARAREALSREFECLAMSVYEAGASASKGDALRSSMRKATRTMEKVVGTVGTSDLLDEGGEAATESEGPHTWPKVKGGVSEGLEEEENTGYVTAAVFEDVTLQSGGMDGLVTRRQTAKATCSKRAKTSATISRSAGSSCVVGS